MADPKLTALALSGVMKALERPGTCSYCLGGRKIIGMRGIVTCPECKGTGEAQPGQCTYTPPSQEC